MDKRAAFIVLGILVILYLVSRKTDPEIVQNLQTQAVAVWNGKSPFARDSEADATAAQWEKHRQQIFAAHVQESKQRAIAKYPALAVANSELNIRFVFRYQWMLKEDNARLHAPNWPELLADDCAAAAQPSTKVAASKSAPAAHPVASGDGSVAAR